jgi:FtsP/CotA-like multicopper oxidase with cupredoxin domain
MSIPRFSRRDFAKAAGIVAGSSSLGQMVGCKQPAMSHQEQSASQTGGPADYTLVIAVKPVELAPNRIVSTTVYNGQFPGPLLRFKEGQAVTIDIHNQTDTPEQLHWHGQFLPTDVDGSAEEGTPFIPPHGSRRIAVRLQAFWIALLPHPRPRGRESRRRTVHRPGGSRVYRAEE